MTTGDARNVRRRRRVRAALMVGTAMGLAAPLQAQDMVEDDAPGAAAPSVPAPAEEAPGGAMLVLDTIDVTAAAGTTTEGTGSWTTDWMRSATGLMLPQKDTPQSTSAVTFGLMQDKNLTDVTDVMENATGITVQKYDSERTLFFSRGFQITNYMFDGVPTSVDSAYQYGDAVVDMAMYDHVELVRGATGLMVGAGEPGASVNFIRKRPTRDFQASAAATAGTEDYVRGEIDISGPLAFDGRLRGRFVTAGQTTGSTQDVWEEQRSIFYGIVEADLGPDTTLSLGASHQDTDPSGTTWAGLPAVDSTGALIDWPDGATTGSDWTQWATRTTEVFGALEHVFDNGWAGRIGLNHLHNDSDAKLMYFYGNPDPETGLGYGTSTTRYIGERTQNTANATLNGDFTALGRNHQFVLGAFASHAETEQDAYSPTETAPLPSLWGWDGSYPEPDWPSEPGSTDESETTQYAVYATGDFAVTEALHLIAGARLNYWEGRENAFEYDYSGEVTPYLGVTYDLNDTYTLYASYTNIYYPQVVQDAAGDYLDPTQGNNYEIGAKAGWFGGALNASAALFQTDQSDYANYLYWDADTNRGVYEAIDGIRTQGFEIELAGEILPGWNVFGGYTYRYSRDDDGAEVNTNQPRSSLKLNTSYDLPGRFSDFTIGGGLRWQSKTRSLTTVPGESAFDTDIVQDPYTLVDAMAAWRMTEAATLQLNVTNLLDEKYYQTTGFYDSVIYGQGRRAEITLRASF